MSACALTECGGTPLSDVVAQVIGECRAHVLERILKANQTTATEVVAIGERLSEIVARSRGQVESTRAALDGLSSGERGGMADLLEEQSRIARERVAAIRVALEEQTLLAQQAMQASEEIASVGAGVSRVAFQARLLSLNANIEATRFGDQGRGFQVIATEMRRLTEEIERANRQIEDMAGNLMGALPRINEHAAALCRHADGFSAELTRNADAVGNAISELKGSVGELLASGDQTASQVLSGSHAALSHLQFQDPIAQSLLIIDADLARLVEHLVSLVKQAGVESAVVPEGVDLKLHAAGEHRVPSADRIFALEPGVPQEAGEVLLF